MRWIWKVNRAPLGEVLGRHLPAFLLSGAVLAVAAVLPPSGIGFRTCVFLEVTGSPCAICGYTRAFSGMAHGEWDSVLRSCPVVILLYGITALVFAWNGAALLCRSVIRRGPLLSSRVLKTGGWVLAGLVLANWIYRLWQGLT